MRICLAAVHANPLFTPLALLHLKAYLVEQKALDADLVRILEFTVDDTFETIAQQLLAGAPDVVGLSCYVWNVKTMLAAAGRIKQLRPQVRVVLGGPEVGPIARSVIERNASVDCIVKSEGELVFAEIVRAWSEGADLAKVKGICFRSGSGIVDNPDAPMLPDLNRLASPHRVSGFDPRGRVICIETQRGCVFRCNFCFENKDLPIRNRRFDLDRVKQEIAFWLQQDIQQIYVMDPIFNLNAARAKDICRFIAEHNQLRIPLHAEIWAEFVDEETARLMREANFQFLEVGLQTTDQAVLATVERRLKLGRFLDGIGHLKRFGLPFQLQLIYGLPGETRASFRKSLEFAASLQAPQLAVFPLMVLPGTELWRKAGALGLVFDPEPPYFLRSHPTMSEADVAYGAKVNDAVRGIGNSWTVRLLAREPGVSLAELIDEWIRLGESAQAEDATGDGESVRRFIARFCAMKRIPPEFYQASAALEFGAGAQAAASAA